MRTLRRYLVLVALMFWLGGFTFYASVVVPIGTDVLGSALRQGFITRRVTYWLNVAAVAALAVLVLDTWLTRDPARWRSRTRAGLWLFMALCQAALLVLHAHLESLIQARGLIVLDPAAFRPPHRAYLWTHTLQWAAALVFIGLTLRAWRREDEEERVWELPAS
jgi:hypothetical protein